MDDEWGYPHDLGTLPTVTRAASAFDLSVDTAPRAAGAHGNGPLSIDILGILNVAMTMIYF